MLFRSGSDRIGSDRIGSDRIGSDRIGSDRIGSDRIGSDSPMLFTEGLMKGRSYIGFGTFYIALVGTVETPQTYFLHSTEAV